MDAAATWDFAKPHPFESVGRYAGILLRPSGDGVSIIDDEIFSRVARFDGATGYLAAEAETVEQLCFGRTTGQVTVAAWVRVRGRSIGFIAGLWQENDLDPRRQYGLFTNLNSYGGVDRVVGHVSHTGGASPGLPYSRDCSASARTLSYGEWRHIAFTYDGFAARSYLDGQGDRYLEYTEPPPPRGESLSYSKNPYVFRAGLNSSSICDLTIGAVLLTSGMGNFFSGDIARVDLFDSTLSPHQIAELAARTRPPGLPALVLSADHPEGDIAVSSGGPGDSAWRPQLLGWCVDEEGHVPTAEWEAVAFERLHGSGHGYGMRRVTRGPRDASTVWFGPLSGMESSGLTLRALGLGAGAQIMVDVDGQEFVSPCGEQSASGDTQVWQPEGEPTHPVALPAGRVERIGIRSHWRGEARVEIERVDCFYAQSAHDRQ